MELVILIFAVAAVALATPTVRNSATTTAATNTDEDYYDDSHLFVDGNGHINGEPVKFLTRDEMDDLMDEYDQQSVTVKLGRKLPPVRRQHSGYYSEPICTICGGWGRAAFVASCLPNNSTTTTAATNIDRVDGSDVFTEDGQIYGRPFKILHHGDMVAIKESPQNLVIVQIGLRNPFPQSFCPDIPIDTFCPPGRVIFIISCTPSVITNIVDSRRRARQMLSNLFRPNYPRFG